MSPIQGRKFAKQTFANGGFRIRLVGEPCFFCGGVLLHKKSLGPAKTQNLKIMKLGFHPHTKPTCPRGGSLNCRQRRHKCSLNRSGRKSDVRPRRIASPRHPLQGSTTPHRFCRGAALSAADEAPQSASPTLARPQRMRRAYAAAAKKNGPIRVSQWVRLAHALTCRSSSAPLSHPLG